MPTGLYGCTTWTLNQEHRYGHVNSKRHTTKPSYEFWFPSPATPRPRDVVEQVRLPRRPNSRASKRPSGNSYFFCGGLIRQSNERVLKRDLFGTVYGEENSGPGMPAKSYNSNVHSGRPASVPSYTDGSIFCLLSSGGWVKTWLKLTTLP